jgi:hypothetical protein
VTPLLGRIGRGLHDADQGNRRPARKLVEDEMRRVRGEHPEVRPGPRQALDLDRKPVRKLGETILLEESLQPGEVEAVDQDLRIAAVAGSLAIGRDDQAIVIHGRGWSDPSDQANGLHSAGIFPCLKMSHQIFWSASE